eukprot:gene11364-11162_t
MQDGMALVPLDGNEGMVVRVDAKRLLVSLEVEPEWYGFTRMNLNAPQVGKPLPAAPGALLNYSVQASRSGNASVAMNSTQVLSLFGSAGLLQLTTAMKTTESRQATLNPVVEKKFTRLGTTFWRDDPENLTTLSVGDDVLQAGTGVPSVRYGGVSWQSNFRLNPSFSTLETPTLFDAARLPSTLEFFLNDRRVGSPVTVAPGPFEISGLPTVGVNGMVKVLIRDALNNERVVVVPYLQTPSLYRQGLHGFSYTAGWLRPDLDRYETPFLASAHRWGLSRRVTLDAGAALSTHQSSVGAGATVALFGLAIGNVNLAFSRSPSNAGQKLGASVQWQDSRSSMGASYSHASSAFELLARALGSELGSVSISWGRLADWSGKSRSISSVGWTKSFGVTNVSLSAVRSLDGTLLQFMLNIPLERGAFLSTSMNKQGRGSAIRTDYATPGVTDKGVAWRGGIELNNAGMALVTTLNPYQKNLLAIKPEEVPMQYRVASNEITA